MFANMKKRTFKKMGLKFHPVFMATCWTSIRAVCVRSPLPLGMASFKQQQGSE